MIVIVADENIECHPTEELSKVGQRIRPKAAYGLSKIAVGVAMGRNLDGFQHCQCRRKWSSFQLVAFDAPVEASDQIDVTAQNVPEISIGDVQAAVLCEPHVCELDATNRIGVVFRGEFCDPGHSLVRGSSLGPGATERRASLKQTSEVVVQTINRLHTLCGFGKYGEIKVLSSGFFFSPGRYALGATGRIGTECQCADTLISGRTR